MEHQRHHRLAPYSSRCQRKEEIEAGAIAKETFRGGGWKSHPPVLDVVAWIHTLGRPGEFSEPGGGGLGRPLYLLSRGDFPPT